MTSSAFFYPSIDYRAHPAFRDLGVPPRDDEDVVEDLIRAVDRELGKLHDTFHASEAELRDAFEKGAGQAIVRLAGYLDRTTSVDRVRRLLARSFENVREELFDEARIKNDRHRYVPQLSAAGSEVFNSLTENGMHASKLEPALKARLRKLCQPVIDRLYAKAKEDPVNRVAESMPRYNDVGVLLNDFFVRKGILEGMSAFFGSNVTFTGYALEYSHPGQQWWRNCYADVGLPNSETAYMHYDHGCKNPKAIVALSEVTELNGPTGYVVGSHRKERSNFVHFFIKSVDHCFYDDYVRKADGPSYYRPRFQDIEHRREFLMLPRALQACSHFGEDIQNDLPLARELLAREIKLTNDVGDCIAFDGDYGIHRGALCRSGERLVFQVIFAVAPDLPKLNEYKSRARAIARKLVKGE